MACAQTTPEQQASLSTTTTANAIHWFTGWMLVVGLDKLKATIKNRSIIGTATFQTQLAMQTAAVRTDNPDTPLTLDSALQGAGERCSGVEDVAANTDDVFWVRFGVAYALQAGQSGFAQAEVAFQLSILSNAGSSSAPRAWIWCPRRAPTDSWPSPGSCRRCR